MADTALASTSLARRCDSVPVYHDQGNPFVAKHVPLGCRRVLDIGCGSGDTAKLLKRDRAGIRIDGVTFNDHEADAAATVMDCVHRFDIDSDVYPTLGSDYDCLLFSHVLEHVREPSKTLGRFLSCLVEGGFVVVAVPNVLEWRTRIAFARGVWKYSEGGILDRTHLRFFTFQSFSGELIRGELAERLEVVSQEGHGAVPLSVARRILPHLVARSLDRLGVALAPNLFAQQTLIVLRKRF